MLARKSTVISVDEIQDRLAGRDVSRADAEAAIVTLLRWVGENPDRGGLKDTPARVVRAFEEYCSGYALDPVQILERTFDEVDEYDGVVVMRDIQFASHCEHHLAPITGSATVAYLPDRRVVGISKLARVVDLFARRLQIQERMTAQIANAIETALAPKGVAVTIRATHGCMTMRGVHKHGTSLVTSHVTGVFRDDSDWRRRVDSLLGGRSCDEAGGLGLARC